MTDFADRGVETGFQDPARKKDRIAQYRWVAIVGISAGAILFRIYVPRFFSYLAYLQLPLLITVYFALMRRSPVSGVLFGAGIGLAEDALSANPLGMYGIVKTLVGYFTATVSQRFNVERLPVRAVLALFFYLFHQVLYWVLVRALLGQPASFVPLTELVVAVLNAAVAAPLYHLLDKLRVSN